MESGFFPMTWAMTNANGRKSLAAQVDAEKDPRYQVERNFWSDFHEKLNALRSQIDDLVRMDASRPVGDYVDDVRAFICVFCVCRNVLKCACSRLLYSLIYSNSYRRKSTMSDSCSRSDWR